MYKTLSFIAYKNIVPFSVIYLFLICGSTIYYCTVFKPWDMSHRRLFLNLFYDEHDVQPLALRVGILHPLILPNYFFQLILELESKLCLGVSIFERGGGWWANKSLRDLTYFAIAWKWIVYNLH